jgi:uncharacterized DUF497 family protein
MYIRCDNFSSKTIEWDEDKNALLKERRGVSFEDIVRAIEETGPLWLRDHPRPDKYPDQRLLGILIGGYVFIVPYEEIDEKITFKTIYPSRRAKRAHRRAGANHQG